MKSFFKEAEGKLKTIFSSMPECIHVIDQDFKIIFFNRKFEEWCKMLNIPCDGVVGKDLFGIFSFLGEAVREEYRKVFASGVALTTTENNIVAGKTIFTHTQKTPIIQDGKVIMVMTEVSDITEYKKSEDALRESEARLSHALQSASMGSWYWDIEEDKRYFDDQTFRLLGISPSTFTGKAEEFFSAIHPDDIGKVKAALARTMENDVPYEPEYRAIWPDGSTHYITARGRLVRDDNGRPKKVRGIIWDVTEHKLTEESLCRNQALLNAIVDGTPDAVYIKDLKGRYLLFNGAAGKIVGKDPRDVIGKDDTFIFPPDEARLMMDLDRKIMGSGEVQMVEEPVTKSAGKKAVFLSIKGPVFDAGGAITGVFGISRDVTEHSEKELELKRKFEEIEKYNKLMMGREIRIVELKKEVDAALKAAGKPLKYGV
jgi:PAS domain S-box-containing protein